MKKKIKIKFKTGGFIHGIWKVKDGIITLIIKKSDLDSLDWKYKPFVNHPNKPKK